MSRPVYDGQDECDNQQCHAEGKVAHVEAVDRMYPGLSSSDGPIDWPTPDGVTHICTTCGFTYYGRTDAYERRLAAESQRRNQTYERNRVRHEEYVESGWDPVCGDGFDDEGWDRVTRETTPARALFVAMNRMPADVPMDAISFFADHHVPGLGRNFVESRLTDVVEKHAAEWGFPALDSYDAFTVTAGEFM